MVDIRLRDISSRDRPHQANSLSHQLMNLLTTARKLPEGPIHMT